MARAVIIKNSFNTGEISPYVLARTDLAKYKDACERLENFIALRTGGITRRPGMRYICPALGPSRLIPFEYSDTQTFALELGDRVMRFFTVTAAGPGIILSGGNPYSIVTPFDTAADNLWDIKFIQQGDVMYLVHPNHPPQKLSRVSDTNWILQTPGFHSPPTHPFDQDVSGGTITLTPGATSGLGVTFTASAPVFIAGDIGKFIVVGAGLAIINSIGASAGIDPKTGAALATTASCDIVDDLQSGGAIAAGGWLLRGNPNGYLEYCTEESGNVHLSRKLGTGTTQDVYTFKAYRSDGEAFDVGTNGADCFRTIDVGRYLIAGGAAAVILSVVTADHATVRTYSPIEDTTVAAVNGSVVAAPQSGGAWSVEDPAFGGDNGYPNAVTFQQDRLIFAGTAAVPLGVWGSRVGDYENFAKGPGDADGLDFGVNSGVQQPIRALQEFRGNLGVFTAREEYMVGGGVVTLSSASPQALTPSNATAVRQSKNGAASVQPQVIQNMLLYLWRSKMAVAEMSYNIYQANFGSRNLNILHELITSSGIKEAAWQQYPWFVDWFTTEGGATSPNFFVTLGGGPLPEISSGSNTSAASSIPSRIGAPVADPVDSFPLGSNGSVPPIVPTTDIDGLNTGIVDAHGCFCAGGMIWVADSGALAVYAWPYSATGNVAPAVAIAGAATTLAAVLDVVVDASGKIYVANGGSVLVFAAGANGNAAPIATITGGDTGIVIALSIAVDAAGRIFVADWNTGAISIFAAGANGNAAPIATIGPGGTTGIVNPYNIRIDASGNLWVCNQYTPDGSNVLMFSAGSLAGSGALAIAAAKTLNNAAIGSNAPSGVAFDPDGNIYVAILDGFVLQFAASAIGADAPVTTLTLGATKGIAIPPGAAGGGELIGLTYEVEQQVWGWHRHFTGQDLPAGATDKFVSVCAIEDPTTEQNDLLWAVTQRQVNGQTVYMVEIFDPTLNTDAALQAVFGAPVTQVSGLAYLAGRTVQVKADGSYLGKFVVPSSGIINFQQVYPEGALNVEVGLPYVSIALTVRPEIGGGGQTIQGIKKTWNKIWARVYNTVNLVLGAGPGAQNPAGVDSGTGSGPWRLLGRRTTDKPGQPTAPYTGDVTMSGNLGSDFDGRILVVQDEPFACTVLAPFGILTIGDQ